MNQTKQSLLLRFLLRLCAGITFVIIAGLIIYILCMGLPHITPSLFALHYSSDNASLFPALVNTVIVLILSLVLAVPVGVGVSCRVCKARK